MDRRMMIAMGLIVALIIVYQFFFMPKMEEQKKPAPAAPAAQAPTAQAPTTPAPQPSAPALKPAPRLSARKAAFTPTAQMNLPAQAATVDTPLYTAVFSNQGGTLKSFKLKKYKEKGEVRDLWDWIKDEFLKEKRTPPTVVIKKGDPVELVMPKAGGGPGFLQLARQETADPLSSDRYQLTGENLSLKDKEGGKIAFTYVTAEGLKVVKTYSLNAENYLLELEVAAEDLSMAGQKGIFQLNYGPGFRAPVKEKGSDGYQEPTYMVNGKKEEVKLSKITGTRTLEGKAQWVALHDNYFLAAFLPRDNGTKSFFLSKSAEEPVIGINFNEVFLAPGSPQSFKTAIVIGPKEDASLKKISPELATIIDYGWFDFLARPFLWLMTFLFKYLKNYGVVILLVGVIMKVLLHPLTQKQMKSMKAMQEIQPRLKALQEKYKDDKQKLQQETMELYKRHGVNPFGGCLPLLLQMPVFIAIYKALSLAIELRQAPFILWIDDLSAKDPYFILPVLMGVSMYIQQHLAPSAGDPKQAQMMKMMNIVFIFLFLSFPSGLVLYYLVFNILSLVHQELITKRETPTPATAA